MSLREHINLLDIFGSNFLYMRYEQKGHNAIGKEKMRVRRQMPRACKLIIRWPTSRQVAIVYCAGSWCDIGENIFLYMFTFDCIREENGIRVEVENATSFSIFFTS